MQISGPVQFLSVTFLLTLNTQSGCTQPARGLRCRERREAFADYSHAGPSGIGKAERQNGKNEGCL